MVAFIFWASVGLIIYHHVGYPVILRIAVTLFEPSRSKPNKVSDFFPTVTIIVPAHNEAAVIQQKICNLLAVAYPRDKLSIIIALDGCSDQTRSLAEAVLKAEHSHCVDLREYQPNVGKVAVLNDQIFRVSSEVVAVTDASALVADDALMKGASLFADPKVGVVTGRYSVDGLDHHGETRYWRYQSDLKASEGLLAGPIGAHGAFYLFRRSAWAPLAADTINDDFVLPMSIVLRGFEAVFEPTIVATELERSKARQEFRRRIRIGAGNLQQVIRLLHLAHPRRGWLAFAFISGKALRGTLPFLLLTTALSSFILASEGHVVFVIISAAELCAIALAVWGGRVRFLRKNSITGTLLYALEGYLAIAIGAAFVLLGRSSNVWRLSKAFDRSQPS